MSEPAGTAPSRGYRILEELARKLDFQAPYKQDLETAVRHVAEKNERAQAPSERFMRSFEVEKRELGKSPVYVIRSLDEAPRRRVLFIHGGGGMLRAMSFHYACIARLVRKAAAEVWMPFYPLAPGPNFFDSLDACSTAYEAMLAEDDGLGIAFAGDSAGANLSLALCRRALDTGLPAPAGVVAISPATGFQEPGWQEIFRAKEEEARDPLLCVEMIEGICEHWYRDVPLDDPLGNPAFIDYEGFPPVLLFLGTAEIFHPASELIAKRMEAACIDLDCVRGEALMHDWALLNYFPEGMAAQHRMRDFICELTPREATP